MRLKHMRLNKKKVEQNEVENMLKKYKKKKYYFFIIKHLNRKP